MFPSRKRRVSMQSSHAIRTLRRLKDLHPDEMVKLDFLLVSEMSPVIRCHNHSMTIRAERQLDIVYRHHALTMRKISQEQQAAYQNLMKVKNDRRRTHREGVIRQRESEVFDYQSARTARNRVEAETRMMQRLTLNDGAEAWSHYIHTNDWTNISEATDTNMSDTSGWLRIRRRNSALRRNRLPSILDVDNWEAEADHGHDDTYDKDIDGNNGVNERESEEFVVPNTRAAKADDKGASFPITSANVSDYSSRGRSPRVKVSSTGRQRVSSNASVADSHERRSNGNKGNIALTVPNITLTDSGFDTTTKDTDVHSSSLRSSIDMIDDGRKTVRSQPMRAGEHLSSNYAKISRRTKSFVEANSDSDRSLDVGFNRSYLRNQRTNSLEADSDRHLGNGKRGDKEQNKITDPQEGTTSYGGKEQDPKASRTSSEWLDVEGDTSDSARYGTRKSATSSKKHSSEASKTKPTAIGSSPGKAGDKSLTKATTKARKTTQLQIKQTGEWGTTTKAIKLPELKLTPIEQVIRYQREADGKLVGTPAAVQPSSEKFQVPSKRADYCRRRALQRQNGSLDAKVDRFLTGCDSVPRPPSTLGSASSLYLFSRHNPRYVSTRDGNHGNSPFSPTHDMRDDGGVGKSKPVKSV